MSFRDIFMKNKKKRPRTPTNDQSESSNSFVKNMKSRVSGLVPARISQWFSSSGSSVAGNGSTQLNDDTDSSEDELELTPPAKRKCLNSQESQYNQQFDVESTSFQADNLSNSHNILYSSIQSPPGRTPFTRDLKYSSTQEESNVESASFDPTDTNVSNKHLPSTSGQSVAMKRNSIFDISKIKDSAKKIKSPPAVTDGLLSDARPRFRSSLYGSPFYPGPTMYGGASASAYINKPIMNLQRVVKVRESNKTASDTLSVSTRRVLDLLEDFPSPLIEAKRIPVLRNWDRSVAQDISSPKSGPHSYKKQELTIPSIASILRLKQHSRLMDTTKAVRQIIASHSSTLPNFQHYLANNSESNTSKASEKERSHKLKTHVTRIDRGMDEFTMPVPVQLPTAVLQIDKDNLPKFSITSTTSTTSLSALPTKSVFDSNYKSQSMSEIKTPPSKFSNTAAAKTPPSWSGNTMFKFANPAASPVHISQDFKIMNKITEMEKQNTNEKEATEEVVQLNTSTKKSETPKNTATLDNSKGWNCSDCWVNNKSDSDRCVCCGAKKPTSKDKNTQGKDYSTPSIGVCMPATSAFVPFSTSSSISGPIAVKQEWTCDNCWIKNKNSVKKCAACGGSKPGGIESMPSLAPNLDAKSEKDWTCETCYVKNKSTVLKCIACSASKVGKEQSHSIGSNLSSFKPPDRKLQEIMRVQKDKWECPGCLIRNESDQTICQCCEMEREGPSKEITPKPFTFPKESNINFKFGIDPKEQEKNIAKKVEEVPNPGFKLLEQTEANNNTYVKFSSNDAKFNEKKFNDAQFDDKGYNVVPEGSKASFTFGIPKNTQEETLKPATVPYFDKPKTDNQDKTKLTFGIIEPPKTEKSTPIKAFPTFLATSTPMTCAKTQSTDAPPLTEIKSTNPTFRFGDATAEKPKQFSFEGESGRAGAGVNAVSLSSTNATPAFSFGASLQNRAASTSASPSTSLFAGPQVTNATTKPPTVTLFGTTESTSATATAAAPLFTFRNDAPSTTPESKPFSFGSTNNSDIKPTQFGSIASNDIKVSPFGTGNQNENKSSLFALPNNNDNKVPFGSTNQNENKVSPFASAAQSGSAPFGSVNNIENKASPFGTVTNNENKILGFGAPTNTENKVSPFGSASSNENKASPFGGFTAPSGFSISAAPTLGGTVASMASSMSGLNESGSGASSAGFRPSTQEAAWPAKSDTSFGTTGGAAARDSTQFTFGGIGNQFGSSGAGTGTSVFGAQPSSATQNVFGIASPPAGGGLFGNTTQPAQPTIFGAQQHTSNVFGAQNQATSTFGVPTPTQSPAFGAHTPTQSPAFGSAAQSAPSAFGAPAPSSQTPAFGIPTQSQQTAFGAPVQNQSPAFGVPPQNQPSVFGAAASSQPAAFGTSTQPTAATGAGFNFGSGVFSFGQQTTQQTQPLGVYSFGSGNTMGGMMSQPMDGGLGAGGVQFTMGSAPAPATAPSMRRVRKAVRRNQPR